MAETSTFAIGVGCRRGCPATEIVALVRQTMARVSGEAAGLFSIAEKAGEPGLAEAAVELGLPLTFLSKDTLRGFAGSTVTRSPRVEMLHGIPSVAETAALAGAGENAVLLVARTVTPRATCAVAAGNGLRCFSNDP